MNVEDVIRVRIADAARKVEAARRQRADMRTARERGLAQRHAAKLRHLAAVDAAQQIVLTGSPEDADRPEETRTDSRNAQPHRAENAA